MYKPRRTRGGSSFQHYTEEINYSNRLEAAEKKDSDQMAIQIVS